MTEQTTAVETVSEDLAPEIKLSDLRTMDIPEKVRFLDTDEILVDEGSNIRRFSPGAQDIKSLALDIASTGQVQPVLVRKSPDFHGKYILVDGFQRTKAIIYANDHKLTDEPIKVAAMAVDLSDAEAFAASVSTFKRFGLSPIDYAQIIQQAHDTHGITYVDIAKKLGHEKAWVSKMNTLIKLRPKVQRLVHEGKLPYTTAIELVELSDEEQDKQIELILGTGKNGGGQKRDKVRAAKKRKKGDVDAAAPLSLREIRGVIEGLAGTNLGEGEEYKYSEVVKSVGKALLKAVDGKLGEKALANSIDRAIE
jgi:ParB/RepB/Spo0J family partition protein